MTRRDRLILALTARGYRRAERNTPLYVVMESRDCARPLFRRGGPHLALITNTGGLRCTRSRIGDAKELPASAIAKLIAEADAVIEATKKWVKTVP